jgi:hypothetical protein
MSSPPPRPTTPPLERPLNLPTASWLSPRVRRELIVFGILLLFGLVGVPLLIWQGGNRVLGPYTHEQNPHAGPLALLQDFFIGLWHGSAVFWVVALGPAGLVLLVRLFIALVRALPSRPRDEDSRPDRRGPY